MGSAQLFVHQDSQSLFCKDAFQPVNPQSLLVHVISPLQNQNLAFLIVELQEFPLCPFTYPVKVTLS